ncbi:MAG: hypothetical protein RSA97_07765, partial [Oscillospiraceae bacterium]
PYMSLNASSVEIMSNFWANSIIFKKIFGISSITAFYRYTEKQESVLKWREERNNVYPRRSAAMNISLFGNLTLLIPIFRRKSNGKTHI